MKTKLLKTKSENVNGLLITTHVYVTKRVANHKINKGKNIKIGYNEMGVDCSPKCPGATAEGYYLCVGGNCIFFPF